MPQRASLHARQWRDLAFQVIPRFVASRGGAVVWPEVEAALALQDGWIVDNAPDLYGAKHLDPHILGPAREMLLSTGTLRSETAVLNDRPVVAFLDAHGERRRRGTEIARLAASKRRLYRTYLSWTGNQRLCGDVAERHIGAALQSLTGTALWLSQGYREARQIDGQRVSGGLDHAGHIARTRENPNAGFVGFVAEDKNIRSVVYPDHVEVWDLLIKAAAFPDRVPALIAPRMHFTTFKFFAAIGAIGIQTMQQWFAPPPSIDAARFRRVTHELGFKNAHQLADPDRPSKVVANFFANVVHKRASTSSDDLLARSENLWRSAAPILRNEAFAQLRQSRVGARKDLFRNVLDELYAEGFAVEPLLPLHVIEGEPDADEDDWDLYDAAYEAHHEEGDET